MNKKRIDIRTIPKIGVADIDVYGTKRKLLDNTIPPPQMSPDFAE